MDSVLAKGFPIPATVNHKATRVLKVKKWQLRIEKLKTSKMVTLKQIESLIKEGKHSAIADDKHCANLKIKISEEY